MSKSEMLPVLVLVITGIVAALADSYDELLTIKPLADGKVLAHFQFKTIWDKDMGSVRDGMF
jgi:hypothetical protein